MDSKDGLWARVYINSENIMYMGHAITFTSDLNIIDKKEIYLTNYISYNISSGEGIDNFSDEANNGVWISMANVTRVEVFK